MLKILLKKTLPATLLSQLHLRYNRLRIGTLDKFLFPEKLFSQEDFFIRRDDYPFANVTVKTESFEKRLQRQIAIWQNWTQDEYLLVYEGKCTIEPRAGWALSADNELIYPSLGLSRVEYLHKPALQTLRMRGKPMEEYAELISLRDTGEGNYYHFYNDVLPKLFFLEEKLGLDSTIPILVSEALYKRPVFQYFLQQPYLNKRNWVVQGTQHVCALKTYFCKPLTHTHHYYERIRELAQPQDLVLQGSEKRIFITRNPKRLRFIENTQEVEEVCRQLGFEIVDFDLLDLPAQIRLLANSRYVVGIHGAGLTNMLFRGGHPMSLLEIYPPGEYYPFHYVLMASQLGYSYDGMIGAPGKHVYSGGFYANIEELRMRIINLLQS